jgi:hypothetical protein
MNDDYTRFVILGDARTGSNMLAQALNTNPAVRCFRELFHFMHDYVDYFVEGFDPNVPEDVALRNADPVRFLQVRIFGAQPPGIKAVGFKFLYPHIWGFEQLFDHLAADKRLKVIHLKRRNWLRVFASVRLAESSGRWIEDWGLAAKPRPWYRKAPGAILHPFRTVSRFRRRRDEATQRAQARPWLTLPKEDCVIWFERCRRDTARGDALAHGHETCTVYYEEILADRPAVFERVQRFLGVESVDLFVSLKRQNPEPLRQLVANFDELRVAFAETEYASFFDD